MKASQKRFIARILTIFMGLLTFLLVDAVLTGAVSVLGGICLVPACGFTTNVLWQLSLRRTRRRKPAAQPQRPASPQPVLQPVATPAPTLYVVSGGTTEATDKPPHVA